MTGPENTIREKKGTKVLVVALSQKKRGIACQWKLSILCLLVPCFFWREKAAFVSYFAPSPRKGSLKRHSYSSFPRRGGRRKEGLMVPKDLFYCHLNRNKRAIEQVSCLASFSPNRNRSQFQGRNGLWQPLTAGYRPFIIAFVALFGRQLDFWH